MGMKSSNNEGRTVLSEINVTPFVDVMLVLLIIFMVTAPILYQGVGVNLPKIESKPMPAAEREKKIVITLNKNGEIFIEDKKYSLSELKGEIRALIRNQGKRVEDEDVFLKADSGIPYGAVMALMAEVKNAGVTKVGLVTEPPSKNGLLDR
jgi:biopolymer transport protein TolR